MDTVDKIPTEVREAFVSIALSLRNSGFTRYSADAILHRIRWHFRVEKGNRAFKCNDHWTSILSRWAAAQYAELAGFFETRKKRSPT